MTEAIGMRDSQSIDETTPDTGAEDQPHQKQLEEEVYARADELARLLVQLRGQTRSIARRGAIEALRDVPLDQPVEEPKTDPARTQNFGPFGAMVAFTGLLFLPVLPHMAAAFLLFGLGIGLLSFLTARVSERKKAKQQSPSP
jgi:hypothetical protein